MLVGAFCGCFPLVGGLPFALPGCWVLVLGVPGGASRCAYAVSLWTSLVCVVLAVLCLCALVSAWCWEVAPRWRVVRVRSCVSGCCRVCAVSGRVVRCGVSFLYRLWAMGIMVARFLEEYRSRLNPLRQSKVCKLACGLCLPTRGG